MSGALCGTCFKSTNDATLPTCDREDCPNKPQSWAEFFSHSMPSADACEHVWGGWRVIDGGLGGEQVCQKCGMGAMTYSLRYGD